MITPQHAAIFNATQIIKPAALVVKTSAYAAGRVVGGLLTIPVNTQRNGGFVVKALLNDLSNQKAALNLYLFSDKPDTLADDATFSSLDAANQEKIVDIIEIATGDYKPVNSDALAIVRNLNVSYVALDGNLYGYLVTNGSTPTYGTTSDLKLRMLDWPDA